MVLQRGDYNISQLWRGNLDPTSTRTYQRLAGAAVVAVLVAFTLAVALRQGVPFANQLALRLSGGRVSTQGEVDVF